jgi:hypothetical protein
MFENLRDSLRGFTARLDPEERQRVSTTMREALVHAKLALDDMRGAITATERRLENERGELQTVRRRGGLAEQIGDEETASIAQRFAQQHEERIRVLEMKLMSQQQELLLGEREYEEMQSQLRLAMSGIASDPDAHMKDAQREVEAAISGNDADLGIAPENTVRRRTRAEKEAEAEERLAALKRRMGK